MKKRIDIIVVNWNSGTLTKEAVRTYINNQSNIIDCNVIVVDNASDDNSVSILKNYVPVLIINTINAGFGKACNQAFKNSAADYILLLNPDTKSDIRVLEELTIFLENKPAYAVTGPKQVDEQGNIIRGCGRFPSFKTALLELTGLSKLFPNYFTPAPQMTDWDHRDSRDVDHIMGSYMLIRKSVLDRIGFLDEQYFVYGEDIDLSKRISDAGLKSFYNSDCFIYHEGGGTGRKEKPLRLFYALTGRRIYWKKHFGYSSYIILIAVSVLIEPFLRILHLLVKERRLQLKTVWRGYYLYARKICKE